MAAKLSDSSQVLAFYHLDEDDAVRVVPLPFLAQRMVPDEPAQPGGRALWPCSRMFCWRDGRLEDVMAAYGRWDAAAFVRHFLNVFPQELAGDIATAQIPISADMVIRGQTDREDYRTAIEQLLSLATGIPMSLTYRAVARPVILFTGRWLPLAANSKVEIYGLDFSEPIGRAEKGVLGEWLGRSS